MRPLALLVFLGLMLGSTAAAPRPAGAMAPITPAPPPTATLQMAMAASSATLTAIATSTTDTPTVVRPTPPPLMTPFPDTPTPALPEEGGPPGGVLGGYLYVDENRSGARDKGDGVSGGAVFVRGLDLVNGGYSHVAVGSDANGYWQLRAVPDGSYQVYWEPPIPADLLDQAIPPAQLITLNPNQTIRAVARNVEIKGANRILDIDFGVPYQPPVAVPETRLPAAGGGASRGFGASWWLLAAALSLSLGIAAVGVRMRSR